jgi:hypothetical protein
VAAQQSEAADLHRQRLSLIRVGSLLAGRRIWDRLAGNDLDGSWASLAPQMLAVLMGAQMAVAREAQRYLPEVLAEQDIVDDPTAGIDPRGLVGWASSGVPLPLLMMSPLSRVRSLLIKEVPLDQAMISGGDLLDGIVNTQVMDTARAAESVEVAVRPAVKGTVRCLQLPSCARCVILAGRWYRWSEGFSRHPNCDCFHIPTGAADSAPLHPLATDPLGAVKAGEVKGLSKSELRAIDDGADLNQVVNVRRSGVQTAQIFGQKVKLTTEGITSRGVAGKRLGELAKATGTGRTGKAKRYRESQVPRLTPESIYKQADDRDHAIRLLKKYGYVL